MGKYGENEQYTKVDKGREQDNIVHCTLREGNGTLLSSPRPYNVIHL